MRMEFVDGKDIGAYVRQMEDHFDNKDLMVNVVLSSLHNWKECRQLNVTAESGRMCENCTAEKSSKSEGSGGK